MKKLLILLLLLSQIGLKAQETETQIYEEGNELKINGLLLLFGYPNISYEAILNEDVSIGVGVYKRRNNLLFGDFLPKTIININTRYYFDNAYEGDNFFIEAALSNYKEYDNENFQILSAGVGFKNNLYQNKIFSETHISTGIVFQESKSYIMFPARAGLTLGVRF